MAQVVRKFKSVIVNKNGDFKGMNLDWTGKDVLSPQFKKIGTVTRQEKTNDGSIVFYFNVTTDDKIFRNDYIYPVTGSPDDWMTTKGQILFAKHLMITVGARPVNGKIIEL